MSLFGDFLLSKAWSQHHYQHRPIFQNYQLYIFYFWQHFCISRLLSMYLFIKYNCIVVIFKAIFSHLFSTNILSQSAMFLSSTLCGGVAASNMTQYHMGRCQMWYWAGHTSQNITHITRCAAECDIKLIFWQVWPSFTAHVSKYHSYHTRRSQLWFESDILKICCVA